MNLNFIKKYLTKKKFYCYNILISKLREIMTSFELKLHKELVLNGMTEDRANAIASTIGDEFKNYLSKDVHLATKNDIDKILASIESNHEKTQNQLYILQNQIRTLQWIYGIVGVPILLAIFMQFFQ